MSRRKKPLTFLLVPLALLLMCGCACLTLSVSLPCAAEEVADLFCEGEPFALPDAALYANQPIYGELPDELYTLGDVLVTAEAVFYVSDNLPCLIVGIPDGTAEKFCTVAETAPEDGDPVTAVPFTDNAREQLAVGSVLFTGTDDFVCDSFRVSGVGENTLSRLAEELDITPGYEAVLYVPLSLWEEDAAARHLCVRIDGLTSEEDLDALLRDKSAEWTVLMTERAGQLYADGQSLLSESLADLEEERGALESRLASDEERLNELGTEIPSLEEELLAKNTELETAWQAFDSEMEELEYFATNQVDMIEKKEEKAAELAPLEATVAELQKKLSELYTEKDQLTVTVSDLQNKIAVYKAEIVLKEEALTSGSEETASSDTDELFSPVLREENSLYVSLLVQLSASPSPYLPYATAAFFVVAAILYCICFSVRIYRPVRGVLFSVFVSAVVCCGNATGLYIAPQLCIDRLPGTVVTASIQSLYSAPLFLCGVRGMLFSFCMLFGCSCFVLLLFRIRRLTRRAV